MRELSPKVVSAWLHTLIAQGPQTAPELRNDRAVVALHAALQEAYSAEVELAQCQVLHERTGEVLDTQYVLVVDGWWICTRHAAPKSMWGLLKIQDLQKTRNWTVCAHVRVKDPAAPPEPDVHWLAKAWHLVVGLTDRGFL